MKILFLSVSTLTNDKIALKYTILFLFMGIGLIPFSFIAKYMYKMLPCWPQIEENLQQKYTQAELQLHAERTANYKWT